MHVHTTELLILFLATPFMSMMPCEMSCTESTVLMCSCGGPAASLLPVRMGLAISLVSTVPEKVWYHSNCPNRGKGCYNTQLVEKGGCAIWYNEPQVRDTGVRGAGLGLSIGNLEQITHTQPASCTLQALKYVLTTTVCFTN